MCGRFTLKTSFFNRPVDDWKEKLVTSYHEPGKKLFQALKIDEENFSITPRYNIAPTQSTWVWTAAEGLRLKPWGYQAPWPKAPLIINARLESIDEKPTFKKPWQNERALVLADGYYEWIRKSGEKPKPFHMQLANGLFWIAAICIDQHFVLLTKSAQSDLSWIHDRMPVVFPFLEATRYLEVPDASQLKKDLLTSFSPQAWESREVSLAVNSSKNEGPSLLDPP